MVPSYAMMEPGPQYQQMIKARDNFKILQD